MREELAHAVLIRESITNKNKFTNSSASPSKCSDTDSLLTRSINSNVQHLDNRTKKEEVRRHKVKMKKSCQFYSTKWISKEAIKAFLWRKSGGGSMKLRLISWALFVCVFFIVSCSQQYCDILSQEQQQESKFVNKRKYFVDGSPGIRLLTADVGVSGAELAESSDWFDDESARSISRQKFQHNNKPHFGAKQARRVIASRWQTEVFFPCQIENLDEEQTVSWIRKRDSLVLTIDKLKLIDDPRFQLAQNNQNWTLVLSQPTSQDAGFYECQVSSMEPKLSRVIELRMVEANSRISNFTSLFVRPNETLNVTCLIEAPHETDFVYWYKNKDPIQFDNLKLRRAASKQDSKGRQLNSIKKSSQNGVNKSRSTYITAGSSSSKQSNSKIPSQANSSPDQQNLNAKKSNANEELTENEPNEKHMNEDGGKEMRGQEKEDREGGDGENDGDNSSGSQEERESELLRSSSSLIIKQTQLNDTANYTCLMGPTHF